MSINAIGSVQPIGAIAAAQAVRNAPQQAAAKADASPSAFFDMTSWAGPTEAGVTVGPAAAKAPLSDLSASVLSAVLR